MCNPIVFPDERPLCEVLIDGVWRSGEVRAWRHGDDGWIADVGYSLGPAQNYLATFPADQLRPVDDQVVRDRIEWEAVKRHTTD